MKNGYTHITVILDRSGSMESIRDDVIGGFNAFLAEQSGLPETATLTLVQFDTQNPYEVLHNFQLLSTVPQLTREVYVPRASTPLLDALGRGINDLEQTLGKMKEADRPEKVIFLIVTDGQENASREFNRRQVAEMISKHEEKDRWQFVYISADLAAIADSQQYNVQYARSLAFDKTGKGTRDAFKSVSKESARYRQEAAVAGAAPAPMQFSDEDRSLQEAEKQRKK